MARSSIEGMTDNLFVGLAEQVKLPLIQILQEVELLKSRSTASAVAASSQTIGLSSEAALKLIDGYLLNVSLERQTQLALEPVSLSSIAYDVVEALNPYAYSHRCDLSLNIVGRYVPVLAHREALKTALTGLGYSLIDALPQDENGQRKIQLVIRKSGAGLSAGMFSAHYQITGAMLERARRLRSSLHQPLAAFDSGSSAGIFIAEALFRRMEAPLKVARLKGLSGFAATLLPSRQLSLV